MYDLLIKNGLVVDGSGDVPFLADVAVVGDSIAKIGHIDEPAKKVIDAQGKIVTPGFIDIHCHSDAIVFQESQAFTAGLHDGGCRQLRHLLCAHHAGIQGSLGRVLRAVLLAYACSFQLEFL